MRIVVTGGAGFIGSHLCERFIKQGHEVVAIDNFDTFYDPAIKFRNLKAIRDDKRFYLIEANICDMNAVNAQLDRIGGDIDAIVHLAARAGVRPSIEHPGLYTDVNLGGTTAILEVARKRGVGTLIFGSSSSVYGNNGKIPFSEDDAVDNPISPYAATKRGGELLTHTYHHLYGTSVLCLRFFTVYGPRQRPDLAIHKFAKMILAGVPIPVYGDGKTSRDYTYVHDIIDGIVGSLEYARVNPATFEIVNLGGNQTTSLLQLITMISDSLGIRAALEFLPNQPGDVKRTFADVSKAKQMFGYAPSTPIADGIAGFVAWLLEHESPNQPNPSVV